jgi:RAD54-like protein 2
MADSPLSDTLDEFLNNDDESSHSDDDNESNDSSLPVAEIISNNGLKMKIKKRKYDPSSDTKERKKKKKSKNQPSYKRRNIRTLLTNDKLQDDTLSALKAEQDRLKRLEEINHHQFQTTYTHLLPAYNQLSTLPKSTEEECIVLDDEEEEEEEEDDEPTPSLSKPKIDSEENNPIKEPIDNNEDSNDSDVQYVDHDFENVNDKLTQKLQRLHLDDRVNVPDENGNILVNINHPKDDPDLYIPKHLCPILKPHQIGGIRFMYDNIVESLQRFQTSAGLGCILAHSMGCGKTVQVITFIDILLQYTTAKSVLIVVPINTIQNWLNEFNRWCPSDNPNIEYKRLFQLYILNETSKKFTQRSKMVQSWSQTGGTLIMGYEMFRLLVTKKNSSSTKTNKSIVTQPVTPVVVDLEEEEKNFETMEDIRNALLNPDLVICDEGHRIKNHQASAAVALKSIRTHRRIVLTGYPLQNNLIEYWCMVDFVRPNYLGSKLEFCNMFERPILNGQCIDSTAEDGKLMRARAHVLHSLLEGFIQRRGHDVLQCDLPPKTEYVILLKLSNIQRQLYMKFLEAVGALSNSTEKTLNPLKAFAICCKIWNHPDVLYKFVRDRQDGSEVDFDFELEQNSTNRSMTTKTRSNNRLNVNNRSSPQTINNSEVQTTMFSLEKKEFDYDFANSILNSYICSQLVNGIKFQVALTILDLCAEIGDKVLIFSQSLLSLNKLEEFLSQRSIPNTDQKWEKNINYYRLDGGTSSLERERLINAFNAPNSNAKLFLLSTRAGCLGINLIAANRVIVMDVSWNPCLDAQAVCRVYRYGQKRHCYIYRLIADFTMEKRIYDRQIAKQGMSDRVVDELQPQNQFTRNEVENLIHFATEEEPPAQDLLTKIDETTDDAILITTCKQYSQSITKIPFTHESLLSDRKEYQLTSAEKRRAEKEYQDEKRMNTFSSRSRFHTSRS